MIARLIISPNLKQRLEEIKKNLQQADISNNHPDILYFDSGQKLGIEQARKIKKFFSLKPYSLKGKIVILEDASKLTDEAQNSLLKTLEELTSDSQFILAADSDAHFFPTVLSRCQIIRSTPDVESYLTPGVETEKLIKMDIAGRFEFIEKSKDKKTILLDLIVFFRDKMIKEPENNQISKYVKELAQAEEWAASNVNIRAILEYLMLVCPSLK